MSVLMRPTNDSTTSPIPSTTTLWLEQLDELVSDAFRPAQILLIGAHAASVSLDSDRFRVIAKPLSDAFAWEPIDAVVLLDGIESIDAVDRPGWIEQACRSARCGVLFTVTDSSPVATKAEAWIRELYRQRFQADHPNVAADDAPRCHREELQAILKELEVHDRWTMELTVEGWLRSQLAHDHLQSHELSLSERGVESQLPYRWLIACSQTNPALGDSPLTASGIACEFGETPDLSVKFASLSGAVLAERDRRDRKQADSDRDARELLERQLQLAQRVHALSVAKPPVRSFTREDLIPLQEIQPSEEGVAGLWRTTGLEGTLAVAVGRKLGWVRIQLRMRRLDRSGGKSLDAEFFAQTADGGMHFLQKVNWDDTLAEELYFPLPTNTIAVHLRPMGAFGSFAVEAFTMDVLSWSKATTDAIVRKIRLLRAYRCTGRVAWRGLKLLATGQFSKIVQKMYKGLSDSWLMLDPEADGNGEAQPRQTVKRRLAYLNRGAILAEMDQMKATPPLTVIVPVETMPESVLLATLESLVRQIYPHWHATMAVTPLTPKRLRHLIQMYSNRDSRIQELEGPANGGLAAACNRAVDEATTSHVIVLNPGFELLETAVLRVAQQLAETPDLEAIVNRAVTDRQAGAPDSGELFLVGGAARQLTTFETKFLREMGGFPNLSKHAFQPGVPMTAQLNGRAKRVGFVAETLTVLAQGWTPVDSSEPRHSGLRETPILMQGDVVGISGYDYLVFEMMRGLHSAGVNIGIHHASKVRHDLIGPMLTGLIRGPMPGDTTLLIAPPHLIDAHRPAPGSILFTMWESDRLNPRDVEWLQQARLILVPSQWAIESFRASGVTVPMAVLPLGYDPLTYHPNSRWPDVCTFGTAGAMWAGGVRKNTAQVVECFQKAFPTETDVRLRVKVTPRCEVPQWDDPRIEVMQRFLGPSEMVEWYRSLSAYVNASAAEGFGLHLMEAMACGRCLISTKYSAVADYFDETVGFPVDHAVIPTQSDLYLGSWSRADDDSMIAAMRQVYADQTEARRRGQAAAARARRYTWKEAGLKLMDLLTRETTTTQGGASA
ncbi:glycosyltransferase [Tuwongella immobilis]|uniref:Glycosyltransferase 2-like domain-containing protein n=1 Tax=Tuwongella immobilis TaxID=692036 RepID=A0A6C2YQS9_9BACT|nr:glycosyltransferase [Tuwongella immobilis]VIP03242.1 Glycosyl transferase group 1 OS=Oscillochloris trichoides DG-6 GN=OSCT_0861 PE=4 SV=1: Glycos_transf_2: Glycos_transf_1 [Tuwongella immobilis]VTS03813.1 Glycosyl transferase group 1 OS=Oscillochloris trichoides DG-6 GN=OSCT_0861 PE=4 SV=1: Glycos_transf_2: Glycos_transf_1 [Tuwongella immobilis]